MESMGPDTTAASAGAAHCIPDAHGHCSICADEALPGVVLSVNGGEGTAEVRFADRTETVALDLIDLPLAGEVLLVHQGFAITRGVDPQ